MPKAVSSFKVLYGELNEQILTAQTEALEKAGYSVQAAVGRKGVQDALKQGGFDLVILGATLTRDDRHHLPYMVKKASAASRVLVLHTDGSRHPYVDGNIDTGSDLEHLLAKISSMQSQPKAAAAAAGK
jgi:DNA-binding NtrC family response regulator